ncbi:MAG: hypothetical protein QMC70_02035 [Bacteroidia bacterium]
MVLLAVKINPLLIPKKTPAVRILDATFNMFFEGQVENVSIEQISLKSGVPMDDLLAIYPSLDAITKTLSERSIAVLKAKGETLAQQNGINTLRELISNDLVFFYRLAVDRTLLTEQTMEGHVSALQNFDNYFDTEMPKIYAKFFTHNKDLLPSGDIDVQFYAHFISHSLKFFNFKTLVAYESSSKGRKAVTEQIIGSLFGRNSLDLPTFQK